MDVDVVAEAQVEAEDPPTLGELEGEVGLLLRQQPPSQPALMAEEGRTMQGSRQSSELDSHPSFSKERACLETMTTDPLRDRTQRLSTDSPC